MKPQMTKENCQKILEHFGVQQKQCALVGVRGYYLDSMGKLKQNDRMIYDDALFWITPTAYASFQANVDPNGYRKGKGTGSGKGMANLKTGVWKYAMGLHKGYQAFVQAGEVTVIRDGNPPYEDTGWFGINIHHGAASGSTSSLGCQTIPYGEWTSFKGLGYGELKRHVQKVFPYVLLTEEERRTL